MTTINTVLANFSNENVSNIDSEIRKIVKDTNNIEQDLENIKNLLQEPHYKESYPNIRPFFENQKGFDALKDVLLFEKNRVLGKTTQENINVVSSMEVLKNIFVSNNNQAFEVQKNITDIDQSIKLTREQSEELKAGFEKKLKERSKIKPIVKLLRFLFTKIANKVFKEMEKEQLGKSKEELNSLKDQLHKITDSFNKELNSLMDAYGKGIESSTAYITPDPDYAIIEETLTKAGQQNAQQKLSQSYDESDYVSAEKVRQLKKQQRAAAEGLKTEYQMVYNAPQHLQIHDLPQPQRAQISEKPKVAPKPSKEVIERALSNSANQQNRPKKLNIPKVQPNNRKLGHNIEGLINKIGNKIPMNSPDTSPKQSPTSSKKSFTMFKNSDTKNEAPKVQETKQSVFYNTVNNGVPIPPPMPTEDDLRKVKLTSGKERDTTSQVNPKKRTIIGDKATEGTSVNWNQALSESDLFKKRKANIEEDKPQAELKGPNIEHVKNTLAIGR